MTYVQGFLTPVPTANREKYIAHATEAMPIFKRLGAGRFVEAWGDDVPDGKLNDLKKSVALEDGETVLFSFILWPDQATCQAAEGRMEEEMGAMTTEMPFDGKRMIWGGFETILEEGDGQGGYIDGIILAVPGDKKDVYLELARRNAALFREFGAVRVVETWEANVLDGHTTDYNRATHKQDGEKVVYSWIEWPDKATRDAGWEKLMQDERMQSAGNPPFDGKRMMWGGFEPVLDA